MNNVFLRGRIKPLEYSKHGFEQIQGVKKIPVCKKCIHFNFFHNLQVTWRLSFSSFFAFFAAFLLYIIHCLLLLAESKMPVKCSRPMWILKYSLLTSDLWVRNISFICTWNYIKCGLPQDNTRYGGIWKEISQILNFAV